MKALVTGGTGFIGANVARELLRQGYSVRALARSGGNHRNLEGLDAEIVRGDLLDKESLRRAVQGCDVLFHVAASYTFWTPRPEEMYRTNVEGTRNVLEAAREFRLKKAVVTSSESTIGIDGHGVPGTEEGLCDPRRLPCHYKRSKYEAERLALSMSDGLPVVVVNPTTPIGPYDIRPTPTGRLVVDFLNRRMPAYVNTGLNIIDVEDVAKGHILALEKGHPGERYVLGNRNMTFKEILDALESVSGIPAARMRIPIGVAFVAAWFDEMVTGRMLRREPRATLASVRVARHFRFFDCTKAVKELGLPQTPVEEAFAKAVRWFRQNGYAS